MKGDMNLARQAAHDKLTSLLNTAEAKLNTLKARAETAKANAEIKAIAELLVAKPRIMRELQELKQSADDRWEQAKGQLEAKISDFDKAVKAVESKFKGS